MRKSDGRRLIIDGVELDLDEVLRNAKGAKKDEKREHKTRREVFQGNKVKLKNLYATLDIRPTETDQVVVKLEGPEAEVDCVEIEHKNGYVYVCGKNEKGTNSIFVGNNYGSIIGGYGGSSISCSGSTVIINNGGNGGQKLSVTVWVPVRGAVKISRLTGDAEIGKFDGDLSLNLFGCNSIQASSIRNLELDASGSNRIVIESIHGDADIDLSGSCQVKIQDGLVGHLSVDISGSCNTKLQVVAKTAKLKASGASKINVKSVTGSLRRRTSGVSSISVNNWD